MKFNDMSIEQILDGCDAMARDPDVPGFHAEAAILIREERRLLMKVLVENEDQSEVVRTSWPLLDDIAKFLGCTCGAKLMRSPDCKLHHEVERLWDEENSTDQPEPNDGHQRTV